MSDPQSDLERIARTARADLLTTPEIERIAGKLGPLLAPGGGGGGGAPASRVGSSARALAASGVVAVVVGVVALIASWPGASTDRPPPVEDRSPTATQPPTVAVTDPIASPPEPPSEVSPTSPTDPERHRGSSRPARQRTSDRAVEEHALLERARRLLASDPGTALALSEEHRARFPAGLLVQEREMIAIDALEQTGRTELARIRARRFAERYPGAIYVGRLRERGLLEPSR